MLGTPAHHPVECSKQGISSVSMATSRHCMLSLLPILYLYTKGYSLMVCYSAYQGYLLRGETS